MLLISAARSAARYAGPRREALELSAEGLTPAEIARRSIDRRSVLDKGAVVGAFAQHVRIPPGFAACMGDAIRDRLTRGFRAVAARRQKGWNT